MGNRLSSTSRRILRSRKCRALPCACILMVLSGSVVAMAMMAKGDPEWNLADDENACQWKAMDIYEGYWWYVRKPVTLDPTGFEIPFNDQDSGRYTVYLRNTWVGDLTGKKIIAKVSIRQDSVGDLEFVTRTPDTTAYVRLEFQTTSGSWDDFTYWWSYEDFTLDELVGTTKTFEVPIDGALWQCMWGGWTGAAYPTEWAASIADVQEIGFSFGWSGSWASGTTVSAGAATFIVESYQIVPLNYPA